MDLPHVFSAISWRSYGFKKENLEDTAVAYIDYQSRKLLWQRRLITTFVWIYAVLLWLALVLYMWEVTIGATATFRYTALGMTTLYIFGITVWTRIKKQSRQLAAIDDMIADLKELQKKVTDD